MKPARLRIPVDIAMTIALILLMGYMVTGDIAHEIIGTVMIGLWILHNLLNRNWYSSLLKGRCPVKRITNTGINFLLLAAVVAQISSGIILSNHVFRFLGIESGMGTARTVHMVSAYWLFILSSLHLGLHWSRVIKSVTKKKTKLFSFWFTITGRIFAAGVSLFGVYAFIKHQIVSYLFMRTMFVYFDFEQSPVAFFSEYVAMLMLFASGAYYLSLLLSRKKTVKEV